MNHSWRASLFGGYAVGLRRFLSRPIDLATARSDVAELRRRRAESFLTLLEHSVFGFDRSPYRRLFRHAGIEFGAVAGMVRSDGLEHALSDLYDAGVRMSLDEFKGATAVRRGSTVFEVDAADFDGPDRRGRFGARSSGSRSARRRLLIDFDVLASDAAFHRLFAESFGIAGRPVGVWRTGPPDAAGIRNVLMYAKTGQRVDRWFAQNGLFAGPLGLQSALFAGATGAVAASVGQSIPLPEHTPLSDSASVAEWLARAVTAGRPAHLNTLVGSATRVCLSARDRGLDLSGTVMRVGSEPFTAARAEIFRASGVRVGCHYAMTEVGAIAMACGAARDIGPDAAHVLDGKLFVAAYGSTAAGSGGWRAGEGTPLNALHLTTVHPSSPRILINVETGDYGEISRSPCGCELDRSGLGTRLHSIGSYEKLTSEGMTFLASDLMELIEVVLPRRFGGTAADYQLVEQDAGGLPSVSLVVSPSVGALDERAVIGTAYGFLSRGDAGRDLMADVWRQAETLRIVRREPYATAVGKILPLHILR
jgi:hypothetical protein